MQEKDNLLKQLNNMIELLAYKRLGTIEDLKDRTIGLKPIKVRYRVKSSGRKKIIWYCGKCNKNNTRIYRGDNYCRKCGTKIIWEKK